MKFIRNFLVFSFVFLSVSVTGTLAQNRIDAGQSALERQVFKKLIKLPYYGVFDHIAYEVNGNDVTLYGKVANARNRKDAERWVEDIKGIGTVTNRIEVLPLSSFDDSIRYRTLRTLSDRGGLYRYFWGANPSVRIIVENGRLSLEGFVNTRGDARLMNILANSVPGVFSVRNNLIVGSGEDR